MPAPDPQHPWFTSLQRQVRWMWVSVALTLLVLVAVIVFIYQKIAAIAIGVPGGAPTKIILWAAIAVVPLIILPVVLVRLQMRRQHRLMQMMLENSGMVCPQCRVPIEIGGEQRSVECARCGRAFAVEELQQLWSTLMLDPMPANQWWAKHSAGQGARGKAARWLMPEGRLHPIRMIAVQFALWTTAGVLLALVRGASLIAGSLQFMHMFLVMSGFFLAAAGWKMRAGDSRYCARCNYEQGPDPAALERCPECGFEWNAFAGTVRGQVRPNKPMMVIGVLIALLGFASIFAPLTGANWQLKMLPTGPLIQETVTSRSFTMAEWTELRTRTLSPDQQRRLATGLLDKRLRTAWFTPDEDNWFAAQLAADALPDNLKMRYYREMLYIELIAPAQAKIDETVALDAKFTYRGATSNNPTAEAYIAGYYIGDDPAPLARQSVGAAGIMLDKSRSGGRKRAVSSEFTPTAAGVVPVKLKVWVMYIPMGQGNQAITWQTDGTPVIPAAAVWHELRAFERTIEIIE